MNSFYKLIASIIKEADEAFSGHAEFAVADPTAIDSTSPVRSLTLDAVPLDNNESILTLAWSGSAEKVLEKKGTSTEINHDFQLISTDLSQIVSLTNEEKYDEAKNAMKEVMKTYASDTDTLIPTNTPKLHNTQASEDSNILKVARVTMQNLFFSNTDELLDFQKKMKEIQTPSSQDTIPLWDAQKGKIQPKDTLSAPSMSYEDVEEQKAEEHQNLEKQIDEKIKTELESALQEKAASVFGPADVELVKSLRAPGIGRNWDEIKKIFVKDLNRDKESTTIFLDEQRKLSGDESVEVKVEEENPLAPPSNLVSPETHEKLLKDIEEKKSKPSVEEVKEKEIEKVEPIKEESALKEFTCPLCFEVFSHRELAKAHMDDVHRMGIADEINRVMQSNFTPKDIMAISELDEISRADNADIRKVAKAKCAECGHNESSHDDKGICYVKDCGCRKEDKKASLKTAADDLNPLQEPIQEEPTMETPKQDVVPMGKSEDHQVPSAGDWVMVKSDLKNELPAFKAKFVSKYMSNDGTEYATVETEDQDLLEVEMYRVTKIIDSKPAAQETDPIATPEIEMQQEAPVPVTPKLSDLSSSQDELLSIKAEAEQLLKLVKIAEEIDEETKGEFYPALGGTFAKHEDHEDVKMGTDTATGSTMWECPKGSNKMRWDIKTKTAAFFFPKDGLKKEARQSDSAFEGDGWVRVWVDQMDVELDPEYKNALVQPDDASKIAALKEIARRLAYNQLEEGKEAAGMYASFNFDNLVPSQHDRIDWYSLANPEPEDIESSLKQAKHITKCVKPGCDKELEPKDMVENAHGAGYLCKEHAKNWNKDTKTYDEWKKKQADKKECEFCAGYGKARTKGGVLETCPYCHGKGIKVEKTAYVMKCKCGDRIGEHKDMKGKCEKCGCWGFEVMPQEDEEVLEKHYPKKKASDFEKGISQNKTSGKDNCLICNQKLEFPNSGYCNKCYRENEELDVVNRGKDPNEFKKTADEPTVEPKTLLHDVKITPDYIQKEKALPATEEQSQVISRLQAIESNLATLDRTKEEVKAKLMAELKKIDDVAERSSMEREYQEQIDKLGILINATQDKLIKYGNMYYSFQQEESKVVPKITQKEWFDKFKKRFEGAEKFINDVKNGMLALAKSVVTPTVTRWPEKRSELTKEASISEQLAQMNNEMLEALKLLSQPL